ncbi:MAG: hypothetical protein ACTS22_07745 [Phycisphaerales bacterium]
MTPAATRHADRARCPECEYDLAGLAAPTCPECGTELTPDAWASRRPSAAMIAALAGLFVSGFLLSLTGVLSIIGVPMMLGAVVLAGSLPPSSRRSTRRLLRWLALLAWLPTLAALIVGLWYLGQVLDAGIP